jgi:hypothetical protein
MLRHTYNALGLAAIASPIATLQSVINSDGDLLPPALDWYLCYGEDGTIAEHKC